MADAQGLCTGCGALVDNGVREHCRGFALIRHPEIHALSIAHVDCDAFFASVEKRDHPELRHVPIAVGGGDRGVVAAACYIARTFGVRSAMPAFEARRLCPNLVFVKSRFDAYREASYQVREAMQALTPLVEPTSIDEAFLDLSGTERLHGRSAASSLVVLQRRVEAAVGVTISVGLSHNKALAKMASELDKPRGFAVIGRAETLSFLAGKPAGSIHGVGKALAARLANDGIETVGDLQGRELRDLVSRYGEAGMWLHKRANGVDTRPVRIERDTKSISGETTFARDIRDDGLLEDHLYAMCRKVSARARRAGFAGLVVTLKLKTASFRSLTRRRSLGLATNLAEVLFGHGRDLLHEELKSGSPTAYRLIGIGISDLVTAEDAKLDLAYPPEHEKLERKEDALAALRGKFGDSVIGTMRDRRTTR